MGSFDSARFNGFARNDLEDLLLSDLWNHDIFNERDMHSSAYFYIRNYFRKHDRGSVYVRCEPQLAACVNSFESVKWGFFHMIYDADDPQDISDSRLRRHGFQKVSVSSINARRNNDTGRLRRGYDIWRAEFDKLHNLHREHA